MAAGIDKTLILATSYAPELRRPELRPKEYPRTDYVELSKQLSCDILDYSIYDGTPIVARLRGLESTLRLDFHLALLGYRRARRYRCMLLMSERVAIPYMMLQKAFGRRCATVYVSAHSSGKQAGLARSLRLFDLLDIAVSNTHAQRDFLVDGMQIPEERIRYVLYAVDEQFFVPGDRSGDYVFSAGGIRGRDYPTLLQAVAGLPIRVRIAAGGRAYGPDAKGRLPRIPENVEMLPPADSVGMRALYQNARVVVVPLSGDRRDAAGCSVVLEAMCCGVPVIASETRGLRDYVTDAHTGYLITAGDPTALRERVCGVMQNVEPALSVATQGRSETEARLSLSRLVRGLASTVQDAAGLLLTSPARSQE